MTTSSASISIRAARPEDAGAIRRLAALDSAPAPRAPVLVAEVDGELRAALSVGDGRSVADPFHSSRELVALLRLHAAQARDDRLIGSPFRAAAAMWRAVSAASAPAARPAASPRRTAELPVSLLAHGLLRAHG